MALQQRRGGTGQSTSLPAQLAEVGGTVEFPVLTAEALLSSPGTQASCQAARRWTWDTGGKGSADHSSKEPVGGLRPAWVPQVRQQWEVLGCAWVQACHLDSSLHACYHDVSTWRFSVWLGCLLTWFGWVFW